MNKSVDDVMVATEKLYTPAYIDFIDEVFISPIRTAVVVDDEFPTLDEFLNDSVAAASRRYADRAKEIIKFCRNRQPFPWIVDIHDGQNISLDEEKQSATHFDHTDLLVLDYHLKGEQHGGDLAVDLLKRLAKNEHFNLVIIYTNNDVADTLREIGVSLSSISRAERLFENIDDNRVAEIYQQWADDGDPIVEQLLDSVDDFVFLKAVHFDRTYFSKIFDLDELLGFNSLIETKPKTFDRSKMLLLFLRLKYKEIKSRMSVLDFGDVLLDESVTIEGFVNVNWLRVDSLFLTVIKKTEVMPEQFTDRLRAAIAGWDPSPHRLIITKMRSEMSKRGVMVEKEVLKNPYLQAAWLAGLFEENHLARRTNVARSVSKHWDSLGGRVSTEVLGFAERLCSFLAEQKVGIHRFHNPAYFNTSLMALHVNEDVCSKRVEGHHLFTGHIFRTNDELWVCLTPACDLEPDRNLGKGSTKGFGRWKPFKAAKIELLKNSKSALQNAARGHHLFLSVDGAEPAAYSFSSPDTDQSILPTLKWHQFYAANQGLFEEGGNTFKVISTTLIEDSLQTLEGNAEVVAQLRYEYALHLLHRLGSHLSRVGLDFIAHS